MSPVLASIEVIYYRVNTVLNGTWIERMPVISGKLSQSQKHLI